MHFSIIKNKCEVCQCINYRRQINRVQLTAAKNKQLVAERQAKNNSSNNISKYNMINAIILLLLPMIVTINTPQYEIVSQY